MDRRIEIDQWFNDARGNFLQVREVIFEQDDLGAQLQVISRFVSFHPAGFIIQYERPVICVIDFDVIGLTAKEWACPAPIPETFFDEELCLFSAAVPASQ